MKRKTLVLGAATAAVISLAVGVTALASLAPPGQVQPYIIGGHPAPTAPPDITSLQYDAPAHGEKYANYHTCGAASVFRGWVVTNAHCVTDPPAGSSAAQEVFGWTAPPIPTADKTFHEAVEEYSTRMEAVKQQVSATVRTSCDEAELMSVIAKAREDGTEPIQDCLARFDDLIATAGHHW